MSPYTAPAWTNNAPPAINATNLLDLSEAVERSDAAAEALNYDVGANEFVSTSSVVLTAGGIAIGAGYTEMPAGRSLAIAATGGYGIELQTTGTNSDGIASYNKGEGAAAFYAEVTPDSAATAGATGYRLEWRKSVTTAIGYWAADYIGDMDAGFYYESHESGGTGFQATNHHDATPVSGFTGFLVVDDQQSGATNNAGVDIRMYQDNLDCLVLRDGQRSNAKVVQIRKASAGGEVWVNEEGGNNRVLLHSGSAGDRGVLRLWDAGAGAQAYAHIHNGAWVIGAGQPT